MRLFVAILPSDELKTALTDARRAMRERGVRGRFSPEENLHLTLAFLGEYPSAGRVLDALQTMRFAPFSLRLRGLGRFDDLWWAGVEDSAPLNKLAKDVRDTLERNGVPFDPQAFSPHITLLRRAEGDLPDIPVSPAGMRVRRVTLLRSDPGPTGMRYTALGSVSARSTGEEQP